MTYDFTVHAPGTVRDAQHALEIGARDREHLLGRTCLPGSPMDLFLQDLEVHALGDDGFLEWPVSATDEVAILASSRVDVARNIRVLTAAAAAHGLAVLDLQRTRLLDMAGAVPVSVTTDGGPGLTWASAGAVGVVLDEIEAGRYPWLILERRGGAYAQTYRRDDGTWDVEHREGGPETHLTSTTTDRAVVEAFLWSWALDETSAWRTAFAFEHLEL